MEKCKEKKKTSLVDPVTIAFAVLAVIAGAVCYSKGEEFFFKGVDESSHLLLQIMPKIFGALLMSGFVQVLVSRELVVRWIGRGSGIRGLLTASFAGIVTPGGPIISFPLIATLYSMGASISTLIAYLLSWELIGMQRILMFEIPLMGIKFTLLRVSVSLFLPLLAGLIAQRLSDHLDRGLEERT